MDKIICSQHSAYCKDTKKIVMYQVREYGAYCSHGTRMPIGHKCKSNPLYGLCPLGYEEWVKGTNYWFPILENSKELKLKMIKL
jgi:hypothetical protein